MARPAPERGTTSSRERSSSRHASRRGRRARQRMFERGVWQCCDDTLREKATQRSARLLASSVAPRIGLPIESPIGVSAMAQRARAVTNLTVEEFMAYDTPDGKAEL